MYPNIAYAMHHWRRQEESEPFPTPQDEAYRDERQGGERTRDVSCLLLFSPERESLQQQERVTLLDCLLKYLFVRESSEAL